ncbi:guanylate-binding protein 3-like [Thomomys bottae]
MAPQIHMPGPVCLVENTEEQLVVNKEALQILSAISQPVVVVAIVGLYRTGKSYLMNKLAGKQKGFSVGSTVQAHTKGIWMWCVPHPSKPDHTLILLDTEGLGDIQKVDNESDDQIFALAILLSSTFVYNTMSTIDQGTVDLLQYPFELEHGTKDREKSQLKVTEITELFKTRTSRHLDGGEDADDIVNFFPDLVWTLRDFYLGLETAGQLITADEYLENSLRLKKGTDQRTQHFNLSRLCIQKFFPTRKCFIFDSPTHGKKLGQLETLCDDELEPDFVQQVAEFCSYIFSHSKIKTLPRGIKVNGPHLEHLVLTYVNAIRNGELPCMQNTVLALSQIENAAAVQKAMSHYDQEMSQKGQLPIDTLQELLDLHTACEREAIEVFKKNSFKDEDQHFQKELETLLHTKQEDICQKNLEASSERCSALLQDIFSSLEAEVQQGIYSKPGGHKLYIQKTEELKARYYQEPRKGIQAEEALQKYLDSKKSVGDAILQTDQALTAKEHKREEERKKVEAAKAEIKKLEESYRQNQNLIRETDRIRQQTLRQMTIDNMNYLANLKREKELRIQEEANRLRAIHEAEIRRLEEERRRLENIRQPDSTCIVTMPSMSTMKAPVCLVENKNEHLTVNLEALRLLEKISQPLVVVAIVGLFRTGKSYLMNHLAGQRHGFPLGYTVRAKTKGIWMWCVPHPTKRNHTLVLLDTEGLGDVEKGDPKNDSWIFALAVLLSSSFVYNSLGTINHQALEQLEYVTQLTQLIKAKSSPKTDELEDSLEFVSFFPDFIWAVRDFSLELKLDGYQITEDEYLENALKMISGNNPKLQKSNLSRECIRYFFPVRKCFVFDRPTHDKKLLQNIENVPEDQLQQNFLEQSKKFCSYIFTNGKTKTLRRGIIVTGNRLGSLTKNYVDAINCGAVPCLENAVATLAQQENSAAVQKASDHYSQHMSQRLSLPTDTLQELLDVHAACEREAIAVFMELSFRDEDQKFQKQLVDTIERKKDYFVLQNEEASTKYCQAELKKLSESLLESIAAGTFSVPGGYSLYLQAKKKVEQDYKLLFRKGVKGNEVLQTFLQAQATVEKSILQSDHALTDGERAVAAERAKKEAAEKKRELLKQQQKELEQLMEAQERSHKENIAQLQKKWETEMNNILKEQEEMLEHELRVQKELLIDGFEKESEKLKKDINRLQENIKTDKQRFAELLDMAGNTLIVFLPGAGKLIGVGVKFLSSQMK